jgi:ParB family chromosome partitioning protein
MMFSKLFGKSISGDTTAMKDQKEVTNEIDERIELIEVDIASISTNPFQPRRIFSDEGLTELASSIQQHGVIQPLIVRRSESGYELVAGERRLRASVMAGRESVPCIVRGFEDKESAELAMIENLQREDLHFFEEAAGYELLLNQFLLKQEELSERIGKSQSTIANKLRLLNLPVRVREIVIQSGLSERHARALLKIGQEPDQLNVVNTVVENSMTVKETELFIDKLENIKATEQAKGKRKPMLRIVKDVRIFINTMNELVTQMKKTGLSVQMKQEQSEDSITITMVVPKRR